MEETEAISRLKQGDIAGLEALVRTHQVRAVRAAYLVCQDRLFFCLLSSPGWKTNPRRTSP